MKRIAFAGYRKKLGSDHLDTQRCAEAYMEVLKTMSHDSQVSNPSVQRIHEEKISTRVSSSPRS